ncbi:MAG: (2Fe-2S)-binding protein [Pseudothermotoga sp.]
MKLIKQHPILQFSHSRRVKFTFDGREMEGFEGEPIAAALHANGVRILSYTEKHKRPRGFFCAIGKCSSCFVIVNGIPNIRSCITPLKEGMIVETQHGRGVFRQEAQEDED